MGLYRRRTRSHHSRVSRDKLRLCIQLRADGGVFDRIIMDQLIPATLQELGGLMGAW